MVSGPECEGLKLAQRVEWGDHQRQAVAEGATILIKSKRQEKWTCSPVLTTRAGMQTGAGGLGPGRGGDPRAVGANWDEVKQAAGIATTQTG